MKKTTMGLLGATLLAGLTAHAELIFDHTFSATATGLLEGVTGTDGGHWAAQGLFNADGTADTWQQAIYHPTTQTGLAVGETAVLKTSMSLTSSTAGHNFFSMSLSDNAAWAGGQPDDANYFAFSAVSWAGGFSAKITDADKTATAGTYYNGTALGVNTTGELVFEASIEKLATIDTFEVVYTISDDSGVLATETQGLTSNYLYNSEALTIKLNSGSDASIDQDLSSVSLNVIPEPATFGLLGFGALSLMAIRRRSA